MASAIVSALPRVEVRAGVEKDREPWVVSVEEEEEGGEGVLGMVQELQKAQEGGNEEPEEEVGVGEGQVHHLVRLRLETSMACCTAHQCISSRMIHFEGEIAE